MALAEIRRRIREACARSGREEDRVRLVAVCKTVPAQRVREMLALGVDLFGENRVQEALAKIPEVGPAARWHLVGHLQRNKARYAVGTFELIHSLDGVELARELDRRAAAGTVQDVLVQVNVAREGTKHGIEEAELLPLLEEMRTLRGLRPLGLMCIPPQVEDPEDSRRWFVRLRELRDEASSRIGLSLPELSMGMSDDFEIAVEEGATLVRIGRALFG